MGKGGYVGMKHQDMQETHELEAPDLIFLNERKYTWIKNKIIKVMNFFPEFGWNNKVMLRLDA